MKFNFKNYKIKKKIQNYIKKIIFFFFGAIKNSNNWLLVKQGFKNFKF